MRLQQFLDATSSGQQTHVLFKTYCNDNDCIHVHDNNAHNTSPELNRGNLPVLR
jgi:hypothetical protein